MEGASQNLDGQPLITKVGNIYQVNNFLEENYSSRERKNLQITKKKNTSNRYNKNVDMPKSKTKIGYFNTEIKRETLIYASETLSIEDK